MRMDATMICDIWTSQTLGDTLNLVIRKKRKDSSINCIVPSSSDIEVKPTGFKNVSKEHYTSLSGDDVQVSSSISLKLGQIIEVNGEEANFKEECETPSSSSDNLESSDSSSISSSSECDEINGELKESKREWCENSVESSSRSCTSNDECDNSSESDEFLNSSTLDTLFNEMMDYMKSCKVVLKPLGVNSWKENVKKNLSISDKKHDYRSLSDFSEDEIAYMKSCKIVLKPVDVNFGKEDVVKKNRWIPDENNDYHLLQCDLSKDEINYMKSCFVKLEKLHVKEIMC